LEAGGTKLKLAKNQIIGLLILFFVSFPMWIYAISSASNHHFFEDQLAVQLMILGGAVATVAGIIILLGSW
jgi:hypothetical protein